MPQDEYNFTGGRVRSLFNLSFSELFSAGSDFNYLFQGNFLHYVMFCGS